MTSDVVQIVMFLSTTAGAGIAASRLFAWMRQSFPCPTVASWGSKTSLQKLGYRALWAPKMARYTVFVLSASISLLFTGIGALITGSDPAPLLSAAFSMWLTQIIHASELSPSIALKESKESEA